MNLKSTDQTDSPPSSRGGNILFCIYLAAYGLFVLANAWFPDSMTVQPIPGINLAVCAGIGLILLTFLTAAIYVLIRMTSQSVTGKGSRS